MIYLINKAKCLRNKESVISPGFQGFSELHDQWPMTIYGNRTPKVGVNTGKLRTSGIIWYSVFTKLKFALYLLLIAPKSVNFELDVVLFYALMLMLLTKFVPIAPLSFSLAKIMGTFSAPLQKIGANKVP